MTEQSEAPSSWERWYRVATSFVAPATFVTALLFYFGYVSSRAQYAYFGVDVDTIGLSTRDFVMRSPQPLLTPLLALLVVAAVAARATASIRRRVDAARVGTGDDDPDVRARSLRALALVRR